MLAESKLILAIAREVVHGKDESVSTLIRKGDIDWQEFRDSLDYHGLAPFAYISLKKYPDLLPKDLIKILNDTYNYYLIYVAFLEQSFLDLALIFEKEEIAFVPIKGMALLEDLYAGYPVRPSTDIDVLVQEKDLERAVKILEKQGLIKDLEGLKETYWREKQYHFIFKKIGVAGFNLILELHWNLDYPRRENYLLPEVWNRLRDLTIQGRRIKVLSIEDTFFSLVLHLRHFGNILSIRDVGDIARLLNKYSADFDWKYILEQSKKSKICATVYFTLYQVNYFFKVNIPSDVIKQLGLSCRKKKAIQQFIEKNTFLMNQITQSRNLYLKAHFLLYDSFWESISYILNIPQEQFAKFYGLESYSLKTNFLYLSRLLYMPFRYTYKKLKEKLNGTV